MVSATLLCTDQGSNDVAVLPCRKPTFSFVVAAFGAARVPRGYAVLLEYRMSKLGVSNAFTLCGTPEYLAPEQV